MSISVTRSGIGPALVRTGRPARDGTRSRALTLVWIALAIFTTEALRHRRRQLRLVAESTAC